MALGAGSFYSTVVAPFVTADNVVAGELIRVRGRYIDLQGPSWETCYVQIQPATGLLTVNSEVLQNRSVQVKRRWPWFYDIDVELPPIGKPGSYRLAILPMTQAVIDGRRVMVEDAVVGDCKVDPR